MTDRLTTPWWALRAALGAAAFLAGLDKFFNLLADWPGYLSPLAAAVLPVSAATFMHAIGIVEMAVGALILAGYTRLGGYVASAWLVLGGLTDYPRWWELLVTAGVPFLTLLMVVLLQHTQNHDDRATQLKLDELIRATPVSYTHLTLPTNREV